MTLGWEGDRSPLVWVVCGIHAREWTSPLACLQIIKNLRSIFLLDQDTAEDDFLMRFRYNFIVMANPDGYIYSMSDPSRRMTRKNRAKIGCHSSDNDGVDLNRNWDVIGCGLGVVSSNPCSETYKVGVSKLKQCFELKCNLDLNVS